MTEPVLTPPPHAVPAVFTRAQLDWLPWLEPLAPEALTPRHMAALVDAARAGSPYFRLLARDPAALEARTRTDRDIFYNTDAGLPQAERELVAAATSRVNGCIYCASVHARFAATYSKRVEDMQRLLDEGTGAAGLFEGRSRGARLSVSPAFSKQRMPTVVRFGVGGSPAAADTSRSTRSLSNRFQVPNGATGGMADISVPIFGAPTPEALVDGLRVRRPSAVARWSGPAGVHEDHPAKKPARCQRPTGELSNDARLRGQHLPLPRRR
jgi:AhpD family alkylhydroperoxidase